MAIFNERIALRVRAQADGFLERLQVLQVCHP